MRKQLAYIVFGMVAAMFAAVASGCGSKMNHDDLKDYLRKHKHEGFITPFNLEIGPATCTPGAIDGQHDRLVEVVNKGDIAVKRLSDGLEIVRRPFESMGGRKDYWRQIGFLNRAEWLIVCVTYDVGRERIVALSASTLEQLWSWECPRDMLPPDGALGINWIIVGSAAIGTRTLVLDRQLHSRHEVRRRRLFMLDDKGRATVIVSGEQDAQCAAMDSNGRICAALLPGRLIVVDLNSLARLATVAFEEDGLRSTMAVDDDARHVVTLTFPGLVHCIDIATQRRKWTTKLPSHHARIIHVDCGRQELWLGAWANPNHSRSDQFVMKLSMSDGSVVNREGDRFFKKAVVRYFRVDGTTKKDIIDESMYLSEQDSGILSGVYGHTASFGDSIPSEERVATY